MKRHEEVFFRTGEEPIDQTLVGRGLATLQPILARANSLDVKLLTGLDVVQLADFGGQRKATTT